MEYNIEKFDLQLIDAKDSICKTALTPTFGASLKKERRKIYLLYSGDEILYVGEANTSIITRFQRGCASYNHYIKNGKARGGYKGYKWLNKNDNPERNLKILVAVFNESYDDRRKFIEAIEGELVFLIRRDSGYWPKFQNEIHFSNCDGALGIAKEILENLFKKELI